MERGQGFLEAASQIEKYFLSCLIIGMTLIVFLGVLTRYMLGFSFSWIEEVPRYCLVWVTFLGAAALMKGGVNHPRVVMLLSVLPKSLQKYVLLGGNIVMMLILGVIGAGAIIIMRINSQQLSPAMEIPLNIIYFAIPLSASISLIRLTLDTWRLLRRGEDGLAATADKYL
jgi:TRAP-type C4-dicarboxylate transport system permease small subunit